VHHRISLEKSESSKTPSNCGFPRARRAIAEPHRMAQNAGVFDGADRRKPRACDLLLSRRPRATSALVAA